MTANPGRPSEITLLQERSSGTFAKVYLAEARGSDNLSRIVAVKVLKEQWSESAEVLDRTYDEARLLARLHHKNILRVEALTEIDGQPAIIMDFVDGVDLKQLIDRLHRRGQKIPARAAYKIAQDTASALEAAYFKVPLGRAEPLQVVHRDVKPSNIMVSTEGEVKVLDFGTARSNYEGRLAKTGALRFGSLKYMSPERREGDRGDHTADVYSLGLVLIEMLKGEPLPVLPVDASQHDESLADTIGRLGDLGLPNEQWEDSLRQTLAAMCASLPSHRLNASQVVQLLRAFSEQASGSSLESFAVGTVGQIAREVYGEDHAGQLSGTRIMVSLGGSSSDMQVDPKQRILSSSLVAATPDRGPEPRPSRVPGAGGSATANGPGGARASVAPHTGAQPLNPSHRPVAQSVVPPSSLPDDAGVDEYMPTMLKAGEVLSVSVAATQAPAAQPSSVPLVQMGLASSVAEIPAAPAPPAADRRLLVIGLVAVFIGLFLVVGAAVVGGAVWYFVVREPVASLTPPVEPAPPPPVAATAVRVALRSDPDALLQWIKLSDAAGTQVLKASPDGAADLPPGDYTLSAKVTGREAQKAPVSVAAATTITCRTDERKQVICDVEGAGEVTLGP